MGLAPEAFVQLLLRERVRILAIAVAITGDPHTAEDVFQQVVTAALQAKSAFREKEHVLAWALRTARHRALNAARDRRFTVLPPEVLDLLEGSWDDPAGAPLSDTAAALANCMKRLSASARRLLQFRYDEGLTAAAISDRTGRTPDAIYQNLARIHRALRECVEQSLSRLRNPVPGEVSR
jgi:RNA polymerase sigma-70 factor (ECF subfamily)